MNTKEKLYAAFKDAMKKGEDLKKTTLRMALAAIKNAEIDAREPVDESRVLAILQKEVKARREAIADARKASRPDLVAEAESEIDVLQAFLPRPLGEDELEALVRAAIEETGADTMRQMGEVMKLLMPRVQGRADGKQVSGMVRRILQG